MAYDVYDYQRMLDGIMESIEGLAAAKGRRWRPRGRPATQPHVLWIFRDRLIAGQTKQHWMSERRQIEKAWSSANPPSDRTIKRAISHHYKRLVWKDGKVTEASAAAVLREILGQK
ncbi:hypothetical protein GGQ80_001137 [Sphingomonas jinjuensis]|uniref:Uncharacterized protein n=1 Tax=Sphingomonas jinjuensis TaxID=535907 RepID=A0A840F656_9SPHN|nr:hypothetical protein [Sphingomonas jinjuensis]